MVKVVVCFFFRVHPHPFSQLELELELPVPWSIYVRPREMGCSCWGADDVISGIARIGGLGRSQ